MPGELLIRVGAVSEEVARAMAAGALARSDADLTVAVTGIAGPGGGTAAKPVGLVHHACAGPGDAISHRRVVYPGGRGAVRLATVVTALDMLLDGAERRT